MAPPRDQGLVLVVAKLDIFAKSAPKIQLTIFATQDCAPASSEDTIGPMIVTLRQMWRDSLFLLLPIRETGRGPSPRAPKPVHMGP